MRAKRAVFALIVATLLIAACGGGALMRSGSDGAEPGFAIAEEPMAPEAFDMDESFAEGETARSTFQSTGELTVERLVIRNANLTVVVTDPAASVDDISRMAERMGGFVVSSNVFQRAYGESTLSEPLVAKHATITIRVPSDQLDEALEMIEADAVEVRNRNVSGQDVTEEFTDLESRLTNLEAAEEQLREILDNAFETEDVLRVFEELRRVREEIELIRGRMEYLQESARLSAITVELIPHEAAQPIQLGTWTPTGTAKEAVEVLIRALRFLVDLGIWAVICVPPIALLLGLPGYLIGRSVVRRRATQVDEPEAKD